MNLTVIRIQDTGKGELISIMVTSLLKDQYYRSADRTVERIRELVRSVGPEYAAKAAIPTRHEFGNRSVSHLVAGETGGLCQRQALGIRTTA